MFKNTSLDKERIQLYLGILATEKAKRDKKPKELEQINANIAQTTIDWIDAKAKVNSSEQNDIHLTEIKLDKRFSENWKPSSVTLPNKLAK